MARAFLLSIWVLIGLLLTYACVHNPPEKLAQIDAAEALTVPRVNAEIQAYMQRNKLAKDEIYYINAVRRNGSDSTYIKISSLLYQTQVTNLNPCALTQLNKQWVLIKTGNCNPNAEMDSLIHRYVQAHLIDNKRLYYQVEANGDSIVLNAVGPYDPELLYITLYKTNVVRVVISPY